MRRPDTAYREGIQKISCKGNCLDNAAVKRVFGHLKDEFYVDRTFDSSKSQLDAYIRH